ncbi:MAG: FAD-binding oxidoreductase [Bacteroidales bacterium]|nr:FAD-binding oxidoreductase [Bacteroidales bacterium]
MTAPVTDTLTILDCEPLPIHHPTTIAEMAERIREAGANGQGIYPFGGGSRLDLGLRPTKPGIALSTRQWNQVVDYPHQDMTITVQAGITRKQLRETLTAAGQYLPVDLPDAEQGSVGGALATNLSGPRRLGRGTLRDYLIGVSFLDDGGREVKGGGRVVKNVAGYDLMKLHIGALGTLGVLTQVTFKVFPKPESQAFLVMGVNAAAVGPTLDRLHESASRPIAIDLLNNLAAREVATQAGVMLPDQEPWVVVVGFEEKAVTVDWQVSTLKNELKTAPVRDLTEFTGPACEPIWSALTNFQDAACGFSLKLAVPPSRLASLLASLSASHPEVRMQSHAGNGIVHAQFPADVSREQAATILGDLTRQTSEALGSVVLRRCPAAWKTVLPFWGPIHNTQALMRTIKATLDPQDLFNPGRMW